MNAIIQDFLRCKDHCLKMQDANSKMELVKHKWEFVILDFEELESKSFWDLTIFHWSPLALNVTFVDMNNFCNYSGTLLT